MVAQLEHHQEPQPSLNHVDNTKSLISALNLVSRNLPLPPDLFHAVSSIYFDGQDAEADDLDGGDQDTDGLVRVLEIPFWFFGSGVCVLDWDFGV